MSWFFAVYTPPAGAHKEEDFGVLLVQSQRSKHAPEPPLDCIQHRELSMRPESAESAPLCFVAQFGNLLLLQNFLTY